MRLQARRIRTLFGLVEDLNKLYKAEACLWQSDYDMEGFFYVDCSDHENSVLSFIRQTQDHSSRLLVVANLEPFAAPKPASRRRFGVSAGGSRTLVARSLGSHHLAYTQHIGGPRGARSEPRVCADRVRGAGTREAPVSSSPARAQRASRRRTIPDHRTTEVQASPLDIWVPEPSEKLRRRRGSR